MKKKKMWLVMLAITLVLGMTVAGCGDDGPSDPISVDLSLFSAAQLPAFTGNFVTNTIEQQALISETVSLVSELGNIMNSDSDSGSNYDVSMLLSQSIARSVKEARGAYNQPIYETFKDEEISQGVKVTGFVTGYGKGFEKDEYNDSVGDWSEIQAKVKASITFTDVNARGDNNQQYTINGKYIYDEYIYMKDQLNSIKPYNWTTTIKLNAKNGYSLSVTRGNNGLKFVMELNVSINQTVTYNENDFDDDDDIEFDKFELNIKVYDNNNVLQGDKTCKTFDEANKYLGDSIDGLLSF